MKHQYVGDERDYFKYSILRAFVAAGLTVLVDWMLTPDDGSRDGRRLGYVSARGWRDHDPELHDWLADFVASPEKRNVAAVVASGVLNGVEFFDEPVPQNVAQRAERLTHLRTAATGHDTIFLDPDNGIEVPSVKPRNPKYAKYVSLVELQSLAKDGHSLIVYQHVPRFEQREEFTKSRLRLLETVFARHTLRALVTSDVVFLIVGMLDHDLRISAAMSELQQKWTTRIRLLDADTTEGLPDPKPTTDRSDNRRSKSTTVGFVNRHGQEVLRNTGLPGTDHGQKIYVLQCSKCSAEYSVNGSSIFEKKCPSCQGGAPGLPT
jgi:hypothetical protein